MSDYETGLRFDVVTIFPGMLEAVLREGILGRAVERGAVQVGQGGLNGGLVARCAPVGETGDLVGLGLRIGGQDRVARRQRRHRARMRNGHADTGDKPRLSRRKRLLKRAPVALAAVSVAAGSLDEDVLDCSVRRVVDLVRRTGAPPAAATSDTDEHHALAREAAGRGIVLLKNDDGLLPLPTRTHIAVIGEFAQSPRYQGAGSSTIVPTRLDCALYAMLQDVQDAISKLRERQAQ